MENTRSKKITGKDDRRFDEAGFFGGNEPAHRLGCTCSTLVILLVLVLAGLVVAVVLASRTPENMPEKNGSSNAVTSTTDSQIESALKNDGEAIIIISEDEINAGLASSGTYITIKPDSMYVVGKVFGFDAVAELEPKISDGQLAFDAKSVKVGNLPLPTAFASPLLGQFNKSVQNANKELSVINFTSVEKNQGSLMLKGKVVGR